MATPERGFEKPNHTQTPNTFFDESLKNISSLPELKIVLAIIRKTFGWQKERDKISMSQLREITGLKQQSVQRGIDLALADGFIEREPVGQQFFYSLKLVTPRDQSHHVTSHTTLLEPVTRGDRKLVTPRDTQKKEIKEKKESPHTRLMEFHANRVGKVLNGGKQGKAISAILSGFSEADAIACYEWLESEPWCSAPDWALVASKIGPWLAKKRSGNGSGKPKHDAAWHARQAEIARKGGYEYRPDAT